MSQSVLISPLFEKFLAKSKTFLCLFSAMFSYTRKVRTFLEGFSLSQTFRTLIYLKRAVEVAKEFYVSHNNIVSRSKRRIEDRTQTHDKFTSPYMTHSPYV
jgi:hypothetical protein